MPRTKRLQHRLLNQQALQLRQQSKNKPRKPDIELSEIDLCFGYARPKLPIANSLEDDDVPKHILEKLELIRLSALEKFKEKWG